MKPKIALFGTSADPPTLGHQQIVAYLSQTFDQVALWAADNPFKQGQTPLGDRQQMLTLMVQAIASTYPNVRVEPQLSDWRSLNSIKVAQTLWPEADLTLVIGTDILSSLLSWYHVDDLFQRVKLLVIPRPGIEVNPEQLQKIQHNGAKLTFAPFQGPDISSTIVRQNRQLQKIPPLVLDYIQDHQLYAEHHLHAEHRYCEPNRIEKLA